MKHLTREEFDARFPRRPHRKTYDGLYSEDLTIREDAVLAGAVERRATVYVQTGSHVLVTGRVDGSVHVARDAVVWNEGLLDGGMYVEGAACLNGGESIDGTRDAVVYDPTEPADSQTR